LGDLLAEKLAAQNSDAGAGGSSEGSEESSE